MTDLSKLSAAQLVPIHNAVAPDAPVKKFESQPRAVARTEAAILKAGFTVQMAVDLAERQAARAAVRHEAEADAIFATVGQAAPLPAPTVVNLVNGDALPRITAVHSPIRSVGGDPVKAARKAAKQALAASKAARKAQAEAEAVPRQSAVADVLRSARDGFTVQQVLEALKISQPTAEQINWIEMDLESLWRQDRVASTTAAEGDRVYRWLHVTAEPMPAGAFASSKTVAEVAADVPVRRKAKGRVSHLHVVPEYAAPVTAPRSKAAEAVAVKAAAVPVDGRNWKRTNATVPAMLAALKAPGAGVTLAELTAVSGWEAPVELRHLRKMEKKRGFTLTHDGAAPEVRRYRAVTAG